MICDYCTEPLDEYEAEQHRCRADETSCVEGKNCPEYIETCECEQCGTKESEEKK